MLIPSLGRVKKMMIETQGWTRSSIPAFISSLASRPEPQMFEQLTQDDRLQLVRFVCSIAWADLQISEQERQYVHDLIRRLDFDDEEAEYVEVWLSHPPDPEEVDPGDVPLKHREVFLKHVMEVARSDGELAEVEREAYELLSQLLR
jgi:uncharacterized tellurite resistance protein B-like protein